MTLRARLTAAFLAVVLGPVMLGAVFVGATIGAVGRARSVERLDVAASGIRTALDLTCRRLQSAAQVAAFLDERTRTGIVESQLASAVMVMTAKGDEEIVEGESPPLPWADCATADDFPRAQGLSARADVHDTAGSLVGYATAVDPIDHAFVRGLADKVAAITSDGGIAISVLGGGADLSTERNADLSSVTTTAQHLGRGGTGQTRGGRYVVRLDPEAGQPLTLALSAGAADWQGLYATLVAVVGMAGLGAVATAWALARSTTRPLWDLVTAVERVASGDLSARVPVRTLDEIGRLGTTFNRMTRETQGYVQALTASRDQLRSQLGVLGDTLSSTHDLNRILRVILQTASVATGAQAGIVLLTDRTGKVLVGQCAEGGADRGVPQDIAELQLRIGEGLLGSVAATGEPRRGRVDWEGPVLAPGEPRCRTFVAVPFTAPAAGPTTGLEPTRDLRGDPATQGVLALYDRHGFDEFDDSDLVTLRTFAGQVAVALDNVRVHEEAQRLSLTDSLTGLSNYRYLKEALSREVDRASRFGHFLAVLVLDLDHFKEINDTYGHAAGDAVLAEFARRVRAEIREVDFAFRQGGEEFVVLLPETDKQGAQAVAKRLGDVIGRTPVLVVSRQATVPLRVSVTVSVGVAVYPIDGDGGAAVLEAADDALYAAKAAGRNTFRLSGRAGG